MVERALVIIPTYNERENLETFVGRVFDVLPEASILVVDDASPDGTGELADRLAATNPGVRVLHRPGKQGLGSAYREGFSLLLRDAQDEDVFLEMDADLSHDPLYLRPLLEVLASGADVAVGSRNIPGGGVEGWGPGRHLLSKGGSLYARLVLGVPVRDLTTGYKAYTRRALEALDLPSIGSSGYAFQVETTYRALLRGHR